MWYQRSGFGYSQVVMQKGTLGLGIGETGLNSGVSPKERWIKGFD